MAIGSQTLLLKQSLLRGAVLYAKNLLFSTSTSSAKKIIHSAIDSSIFITLGHDYETTEFMKLQKFTEDGQVLFERKYEVGGSNMNTIVSLILYPDQPSMVLVDAAVQVSSYYHKVYFIVNREDGSLIAGSK